MPATPRTHRPSGIYFVRLLSRDSQILLFNKADRTDFETRLAAALTDCAAQLHAYCWVTHELQLAIQASDGRVERIVRRIAGPYARLALRRRGTHGHLFQTPYSATLVDDGDFLQIVRFIHHTPLRNYFLTRLHVFRGSSHTAYLGLTDIPWLTTVRVRQECAQLAGDPDRGYWQLMHLDSPATLEEFRRRAELESLEALKRIEQAKRDAPPDPLERLVAEVASAYGVTVEAMRSASRQRLVSQARATVCWRATTEGIAELDVVAGYFNRKPQYFNARYASMQRRYTAAP